MSRDNSLSGILVCVLYFILGVVLITATTEFIKTFNYILVSISAIIGVIKLINFVIGKKYKEDNYNDLLIAVLFIWISLVLYVYYGFMIIILPMLFSLYLFIMGIEMIIKYSKFNDWKYLVLALIAIILGILLIFNPGSIIFTYLKIVGIYLVLVSCLSFGFYLKFKKYKSE